MIVDSLYLSDLRIYGAENEGNCENLFISVTTLSSLLLAWCDKANEGYQGKLWWNALNWNCPCITSTLPLNVCFFGTENDKIILTIRKWWSFMHSVKL